ncbi:hypothetical protein GOARA_022_00040 [Gordonia araii NBRC 100433]|uniref:Mce-associated membrane protein n=1 Tax=Gordonia araii NBRC 100433 TaxID=1073574 RepID=G7GZA3_9ACTN|nr:hypothetical protein [Gordonia araii]NNG98640.1 hypothetical protein [Gordonia araii NBRC 100433]GAB08928.1 hypothetical protein GOARA_022_00040 [Gordonia araii NBRC 100433]
MSSADRATRRWREARIAAGPALRRRAARRRRQLALGIRVVVALGVLAIVAALVFGILDRRGALAHQRGDEAQLGARAALQTMLSADPRKAEAYVDAVLAVSAGSQRARIEAARGELAAEIAAQSGPSTGQVLATALVDEPSPSGPVTVLVVAEATNPQLIGADTTAKRVPVVVTMTQVDGRWLVEQARQA